MDWQERTEQLRRAFTPSAPVTDRELFAGRTPQLVRVVDAINSVGEHAAIFGERGVGKTSLAAISEAIATVSGSIAIRLNCQAKDDIHIIWRRVGDALDRKLRVLEAARRDVRDIRAVAPEAIRLLSSPEPTANDFLTSMEILTSARGVVLFMDEFDRLGDYNVQTDLVDVMKTISDHALRVTVVVVGVAADVDSLIDEHESIGRGLNEIEMPRMSKEELVEIITRGLGPAEMSATAEAADFVAELSIGLPHYTHLMALHAGLRAISRESDSVKLGDVLDGLPDSLARAQQHVARLYYTATHSTQANLYKEVLLSAALTPTDDRGYFAPGDMREALAAVAKRKMEIPSFAGHLSAFADDRGPVLQRSGKARRPRYRFAEPLLVPYASMRGVHEGLIGLSQMRELLGRRVHPS